MRHPQTATAIRAYIRDMPNHYVVLRRGAETTLVKRSVWEERDKSYGPNHKPWARQLLDAGYVVSNENPADLVDVRGRRYRDDNKYKVALTIRLRASDE